MTKRKSVAAKSDMAKARYGKTLTQTNQMPTKPKLTVRPKGNPLSGVYGFKGKVTF